MKTIDQLGRERLVEVLAELAKDGQTLCIVNEPRYLIVHGDNGATDVPLPRTVWTIASDIERKHREVKHEDVLISTVGDPAFLSVEIDGEHIDIVATDYGAGDEARTGVPLSQQLASILDRIGQLRINDMKLINYPEVQAKLGGMARETIDTMVTRAEFPQPVQIAPRRVAFIESEIDDWIASRPRGKMAWANSLRKNHEGAK